MNERGVARGPGRPKSIEPYFPVNIYVYKAQMDWLKQRAHDKRSNRSTVVRELIIEAMAREAETLRDNK